MTSIQDRDFRQVRGHKSVEDLSRGNPDYVGSFGVEEEAFYLDSNTLDEMNDAQNKKLFKEVGFGSVEPDAAQAEHVSEPKTLQTIQHLFEQMQSQRQRLYNVCENIGVSRNPFSTVPHVDGHMALKNIIKPSEEDKTRGVRQRLLMSAFGAANPGSPYYPVLNTALHYTTAVRDMDDDLVKGRRAQFLMPFLLTLMENRSPFNAGSNKGLLSATFNQAMAARLDLGSRGGIDDNYFLASSGEELSRLKFDEVMHTEMFAYYRPAVNENGETVSEFVPIDARKEKMVKFGDLAGTPLGYRTQYYMARSQKWKWLKTKNIFDDKGNGRELLQERRDFDPGIHQLQTMTLILAAIDHDEGVANAVDDLLSVYGFDAAKHDDNGFALLQNSLASAYYRGNEAFHGTTEYMNIRYGNGNMQEFGKQFMKIMDEFYAQYDKTHGADMVSKLNPMRYIIETGRTDAQVAAELIKTPDDNLPFIREFDHVWFLEPTKCLGLLQEEGALTFQPE
jgi:hypothetical protein